MFAIDQPIVVHGMANILAGEVDIDVVATCSNAHDVFTAIRTLHPDIVVIDPWMPEVSGLEVLAAMGEKDLMTRVVLLTSEMDDAELLDAIALGVHGLVSKEASAEELLGCIRTVAAGGHWLPEGAKEAAIGRELERRAAGIRQLRSLTTRERELVALVAEGLANKQIAQRLQVFEGTVKTHLHNIYRKLSVTNRTALAAIAARHARVLRSPDMEQGDR